MKGFFDNFCDQYSVHLAHYLTLFIFDSLEPILNLFHGSFDIPNELMDAFFVLSQP